MSIYNLLRYSFQFYNFCQQNQNYCMESVGKPPIIHIKIVYFCLVEG